MDRFNKKVLKSLMNNPEGVCVSLYIPTGSKPEDRQENQIRFKNLLREAEDALITEQHPEPGIQDFLAPAHNLRYMQSHRMRSRTVRR